MADMVEIAEIISVISAAYPNFNPTEYTAEVYYRTLKDLPGDELKAATLHCIAESGRKFAPSVGELRGAVGELRRYTFNIPSAFEAWQEVITQLRDNGGDYGNPVWSHPLVERAVQQIGWRSLRFSENQTADRARFIQCYEQLEERAEKENLMLPDVRGYIEVNGGKFLAPVDQVLMLTEKLNVRKDGDFETNRRNAMKVSK